jgi:LacI family transcriptional regulator
VFQGRYQVLQDRVDAYQGILENNQVPVFLLDLQGSPSPWLRSGISDEEEALLRQWLRDLPKPVGIFCMSDPQARAVEMMCLEMNIRIPSEVGILGTGNRAGGRMTGQIEVSHIEVPLYEMGYHAGGEISKMLKDPAYRTAPKVFSPLPAVECGSTDIRGASDPVVASCIQYIREHVIEPLSVPELVKRAPVCRSILERRFKQTTGRTPLEEIHYWKTAHAKELLRNAGLSIAQISDQCGFNDPYQFSSFFKKQTGLPPLKYRYRHSGR